MLGNIVLGRPKTPGNDHHIYPGFRIGKGLEDMVPVVLHRGDLVYAYPDPVEFPGYKGRIGINDLPDKDLIANGNDLCLHELPDIFLEEGIGLIELVLYGKGMALYGSDILVAPGVPLDG